METDAFIGMWELDPAQSEYQYGTPPQSGLYRIAADAAGTGYMISMTWTNAQGSESYAAYTALPDGVQYPYENPDVADFISMTRLDERTLDSAIYKGGEVIAYALRELSDDGQLMRIVQSGYAPDGSTFNNLSIYVRQTDGIN